MTDPPDSATRTLRIAVSETIEAKKTEAAIARVESAIEDLRAALRALDLDLVEVRTRLGLLPGPKV